MKNTKLKTAVRLVLVAALASPTAFADDSFWYAGLNLGAAKATIDNDRVISGLLDAGFTPTALTNDTRTNGGRVFGGYQFSRLFAIEGGYFDIGDYGYTAETLPLGSLDGRITVRGYNLDLLGFIPVTDRFSILGRVGANYAKVDGTFVGTGAVNVLNPNPSETDTNIRFGVGLQYAFTDQFRMRVESERYRINDAVGNKGDIDMVTVGVVWKFGASTPAPIPVAAPPPRAVTPPPPVAPPAPVPTQQYCGTLDINFDINKHDIQLADHEKLRELADFLRQFPSVTGVIEGHTDNVGSAEANMRLSQRRADSVVAHLVGVHGIAASRLRAVGYGESRTLPVEAVSAMAEDNPADVLRSISTAALNGWRKNFPVTPVVSEESVVDTPYGEALVTVYHAERGSTLMLVPGGAPTGTGERFDTHIVSMVVRQGAMVAFVMTQDDGYATEPRPDATRNITALKARAEQVLLSLKIPAERSRSRRR